MKPELLTKILPALLVGVLAWKWALVPMAVTNPPWSLVGFSALLFVLLTTASIIGLLRLRTWGFVCAYLLVPVSTLLHGIALVPLVTELVPGPELQSWAMAIVNVMFLGTLVVTICVRREGRGPRVQDRTVSWRFGWHRVFLGLAACQDPAEALPRG